MFYLYVKPEKKRYRRVMMGYGNLDKAHIGAATFQRVRFDMYGHFTPIYIANALLDPGKYLLQKDVDKAGGWYEELPGGYFNSFFMLRGEK